MQVSSSLKLEREKHKEVSEDKTAKEQQKNCEK